MRQSKLNNKSMLVSPAYRAVKALLQSGSRLKCQDNNGNVVSLSVNHCEADEGRRQYYAIQLPADNWQLLFEDVAFSSYRASHSVNG